MQRIFLLICFICIESVYADAIDDAFNAQNKQSTVRTTVDSTIYSKTNDSSHQVFDRNREVEQRRREEFRTQSGGESGGKGAKIYACDGRCVGSLFAVGINFKGYKVNGNDADSAAENARREAEHGVCEGGGKGDHSRAWWAEVSSTNCKLL